MPFKKRKVSLLAAPIFLGKMLLGGSILIVPYTMLQKAKSADYTSASNLKTLNYNNTAISSVSSRPNKATQKAAEKSKRLTAGGKLKAVKKNADISNFSWYERFFRKAYKPNNENKIPIYGSTLNKNTLSLPNINNSESHINIKAGSKTISAKWGNYRMPPKDGKAQSKQYSSLNSTPPTANSINKKRFGEMKTLSSTSTPDKKPNIGFSGRTNKMHHLASHNKPTILLPFKYTKKPEKLPTTKTFTEFTGIKSLPGTNYLPPPPKGKYIAGADSNADELELDLTGSESTPQKNDAKTPAKTQDETNLFFPSHGQSPQVPTRPANIDIDKSLMPETIETLDVLGVKNLQTEDDLRKYLEKNNPSALPIDPKFIKSQKSKLHIKTFDDVYKFIEETGRTVGKLSQAQNIISKMKKKKAEIEKLAKKWKRQAGPVSIGVYIETDYPNNRLLVEMAKLMGLTNIKNPEKPICTIYFTLSVQRSHPDFKKRFKNRFPQMKVITNLPYETMKSRGPKIIEAFEMFYKEVSVP